MLNSRRLFRIIRLLGMKENKATEESGFFFSTSQACLREVKVSAHDTRPARIGIARLGSFVLTESRAWGFLRVGCSIGNRRRRTFVSVRSELIFTVSSSLYRIKKFDNWIAIYSSCIGVQVTERTCYRVRSLTL